MLKVCFIFLTAFSSSPDKPGQELLLDASSFWKVSQIQVEPVQTVIVHTDGLSVTHVSDSVKSIYDQLLNCRH